MQTLIRVAATIGHNHHLIKVSSKLANTYSTHPSNTTNNRLKNVTQMIIAMKETCVADSSKSRIILDKLNNDIRTYLTMPSIKPVVQFFSKKGIKDHEMKDIFFDHGAWRAPSVPAGLSALQNLLLVYDFHQTIPSNNPEGKKNSTQLINIAGENQIGVTLIVKDEFKEQIPPYFFLSMRDGDENIPFDITTGYDTRNFPALKQSRYWKPAQECQDTYGKPRSNHWAIDVQTCKDRGVCTGITDLKNQFEQAGFQVDQTKSIGSDPDLIQQALKGETFYVEYLERRGPGFASGEAVTYIGNHLS